MRRKVTAILVAFLIWLVGSFAVGFLFNWLLPDKSIAVLISTILGLVVGWIASQVGILIWESE